MRNSQAIPDPERTEARRRGLTLTLLALLPLTAACGDTGQEAETPTPTPPVERSSDVVTPASYLTSLSFVSFAARPARLHLRFLNKVTQAALARDYQGWLGRGERWDHFLSVDDTLDLPRAAWRVIPTRELRLEVGDGGDLVGIRFADSLHTLALRSGDVIDEWTGPTGQRETLRFGRLTTGGVEEKGLLLQRMGARPAAVPPPSTLNQIFLVADPEGDGMLIIRDGAGSDAPVTGYGWIGGKRVQWPDAALHPVHGEGAQADRWAVQLSPNGLSGELETAFVAVDRLAEGRTGLRLFQARGSVDVQGTRHPVTGLGVEYRGP